MLVRLAALAAAAMLTAGCGSATTATTTSAPETSPVAVTAADLDAARCRLMLMATGEAWDLMTVELEQFAAGIAARDPSEPSYLAAVAAADEFVAVADAAEVACVGDPGAVEVIAALLDEGRDVAPAVEVMCKIELQLGNPGWDC